MPELPEVETVRSVLSPQLRGRRINDVSAVRPEVLAHPTPEEFIRLVKSARFGEAGRRGKFLLFPLSGGAEIILHLRMTGSLVCAEADQPRSPHTHVIFHLDAGPELRFSDVRRFGRLWLKQAGEQDNFSGVEKLGPEPFDEIFSAEYLKQKLGARRITIKQGLLDQTVVAGVGNIYSDEALYSSKINPGRPTQDITGREWHRLAETVPLILTRAINKNRVSPKEYAAMKNGEYKYNDFAVYGREGQACACCGALIKRVKIAGRSSFSCPKCQK